MTDIATWDILKWVLLVLLAGFIGQFGKSFAQAAMARMRKKRSGSAAPPVQSESSGSVPGTGERKPLPGPDEPSGPRPDGGVKERPSVIPSPAAETLAAVSGTDKKSLKALAKQQKKEAKLRSKLPQ
jgi:hypothetical protein